MLFLIIPLPGQCRVLQVKKLLKNLFKNLSKCVDFNFVLGGGGGGEGENLDKAVFTTGNGRSLANSLAKGGRKGTCLKPFWRGLCRNKTKET